MKMTSKFIIIEQLIACIKSLFCLPTTDEIELRKKWQYSLPDSVNVWYARFYQEVFQARKGYPSGLPSEIPYTEDFVIELLERENISNLKMHKLNLPTLCLTHDVDHLEPNLKYYFKTIIAQRMIPFAGPKNFLSSLEKLLKIDNELTEKQVSTLFIAAPIQTSHYLYRPFQWLIDPSYNAAHPLFKELIELSINYNCDIGLHGSFFSISHQLIGKEKETLEKFLTLPLQIIRQHWLHIPNLADFQQLATLFKIDSTLGWNGHIGFRGGMARPFKLILSETHSIWEIPLLIMDGALYADQKLEHKEVIKQSKKILLEVKKRNGCMAINWHERAAHSLYNWHLSYEDVLKWSKENGFEFKKLSQVIQ